METIFLTATPEEKGRRLDQFLAEQLEELTRSAAQRLTEEEHVLLGGKPLKKNYKMTGNETLEVHLPDPEPIDAVPQNIPLDIAYEDEDLLVINKPKGMVVHPAPGNPDGTVVNAVLYHCGESLSGICGAFRPGIVHRIDKDTSGLLIIAKNDKAHLYLSEQLKDHTLARTYEAVVIGGLKEERGAVSAPIGRSPKDRKKMAIVPDGRHAVTHYEVIARYPGYTHIRCKLETGRTHQIRVHMASLGHPIVGDEVYGPSKSKFDLQGQCLHARELTFLHPADGQPRLIKSELPDYFTDLLHKLGRTV